MKKEIIIIMLVFKLPVLVKASVKQKEQLVPCFRTG